MSNLLENKQSRYLPLLLILLTMVNTIGGSYAASYIINPNNTNVSFAIERFKSLSMTGGFYQVKGQLQYDPILKAGDISLIIPINSLDTGSKGFNKNLKGVDFFDIQRFPSAHFQSTNWYFNKSKVTRVDGNLTLHGVTHPISLTANEFNCYLNATAKNEVCTGVFSTTIDRTKWNINKHSWFGLTKNLDLNVHVEAMKQ
ncbi:polyisoprenoid-binding protein YceI [Psychrobacter luti]|uniref:Polyisoprenoid-binding protein YceI n=1 Tax=Psychrobacter luti TaxID=198481 RepID=A0A839TCK5_9GAMM|nr:YceI family protein [Psychrobacter luti]MBB3105824.1 polyisoprenoid-binding protein YceI [Psychrobacter luti]